MRFSKQLFHRFDPFKFVLIVFSRVKKHQEEIILFIGVILISLLSFAGGYITAKKQAKKPVIIHSEVFNNDQ